MTSPIIDPRTGRPVQPDHVFVFNPKQDISVLELAETIMLVLAAQRFALTDISMLSEQAKAHFDLIYINGNEPANSEMGVGDASATGAPSIGNAS